MQLLNDVDEVQSIDSSGFKREYFDKQRPLVIRNLAASFPAGKKWTLDFLRSHCGDVEIDLFDNGKKDRSSSAFTTPDVTMPFHEYLDVIEKGEPTNLRMFLFNMFKCKPELRDDFPCPDFFRSVIGKIGFMFFGSREAKVRVHQDIDMSCVLLTQFSGYKRVVLVAPQYSELMYRLPFNTYSLVDLDAPDLEKYPGLRYIQASECILGPGDALFMPSGYWHYITYLDGGFAVSYRKPAPGILRKIKGMMYLGIFMPLDKLMNKLAGEEWVTKKEQMAETRAKKAIQRLYPEESSCLLKQV
jgi:hypothetical protein